MTTTDTAGTTAIRTAGPASRPDRQWWALGRLQVADALRGLTVTALVTLAVLGVMALVARWQGWDVVVMDEVEWSGPPLLVEGGRTILWVSLVVLPISVGIAAVVHAVLATARTRVHVASGATRWQVVLAHLLTVAAMTVYVLVVALVVLLLLGSGPGGAVEILGSETAGGPVPAVVAAVGATVGPMMAAVTITAMFLRWPWWVGTGVLVGFFVVLPMVAGLLPAVGEALDRADAWWGSDLLVAVVLTGVFVGIMRRVPVK